MIWKLAMPEGRIIEVLRGKTSNNFYTDVRMPALLQTCSESRVEALRVYKALIVDVSDTKYATGFGKLARSTVSASLYMLREMCEISSADQHY